MFQDLSLGCNIAARHITKMLKNTRANLRDRLGAFDNVPGGNIDVVIHPLKHTIVRSQFDNRRDRIADRRSIPCSKYNSGRTRRDEAGRRFLIVSRSLHEIDAAFRRNLGVLDTILNPRRSGFRAGVQQPLRRSLPGERCAAPALQQPPLRQPRRRREGGGERAVPVQDLVIYVLPDARLLSVSCQDG